MWAEAITAIPIGERAYFLTPRVKENREPCVSIQGAGGLGEPDLFSQLLKIPDCLEQFHQLGRYVRQSRISVP